MHTRGSSSVIHTFCGPLRLNLDPSVATATLSFGPVEKAWRGEFVQSLLAFDS
jgi:hypothetical protein